MTLNVVVTGVKRIAHFLPLREVLSKWKDRRKKVQLPLFPGYLFVHVPYFMALDAALETPFHLFWQVFIGVNSSPKFCR